jgi:NADH-quinone oxidoreductase subunit J
LSFELIIWGVLAGAAVILAVMMLWMKSPVHAALCLIGVMACLAVLYLMLGAFFLGMVQVVVYAGAVMVLFLFVIMFFYRPKQRIEYMKAPRATQIGGAALVAFVFFCLLMFAFGNFSLTASPSVSEWKGGLSAIESSPQYNIPPAELDRNNPHLIGELLFSRYLLPFELTSLLLLAAMIGAVVLAKRSPGGNPKNREGGESG